MKQLVYTIALMLVLVGSAAAQRNTNDAGLWEDNSLILSNLVGVQASSGVVDTEDDTLWGHTFALRNAEANLTASLNYTSYVPSVDGPNKIIGGTWTMSIYKEGEFKGMVFGEFDSGTIEWSMTRTGVVTGAAITAQMSIKGGTESYAHLSGTKTNGNFYGQINYSQGGRPTITGFTDLRF